MIIAERKPLEEIVKMIGEAKKVLLVGCGTCVSVCMAGGEKEVAITASQLRLLFQKEGKSVTFEEVTAQRQCDTEYIEPLAEKIRQHDLVLSLACGAGVQFMAQMYNDKAVIPGLNTKFIGVTTKEGQWDEKCRACGECVLGETGGVCPVTICAKGLMNGPCGGTNHGKCEVEKDRDCAWTLIYRRLEKLGQLDNIRKVLPAKNYRVQTTPGRCTHEAYEGVKDEANV